MQIRFNGTFAVTQGYVKAAQVAQQVVGEDGTLHTQHELDGTVITVPDRFDDQLTRAFREEGIHYSKRPSALQFAGKTDDDKAVIRIDYDPETAPDASAFVPMFTWQLMMRNPQAGSMIMGQLKPGEGGHDVLELQVDRAGLEDALLLLEEIGAPVLGSEPPVGDDALRAKQAEREQALRDARPLYKKILGWILRK